MRILFVSGTSVGGAARSTHELAGVLAARGHHVATLMSIDEDARATERHKRLLNLDVKLHQRGRLWAPAARIAGMAKRRVGRRLVPEPTRAYPAWRAAIVENAIGDAIDRTRPDVVVVNSIERPAWREVLALLRERHLPSVLYLRETTGLRHLAAPPALPDLLLANAQAHADGARALGYACEYVPSVVHLDACRVASTRERVLFINPVPVYGVDIAVELARTRPDVPFVFQESWPIDDADRRSLDAAIAGLANVELRARTDELAAVYRDARVLLFACTVASRPRVVLEAQASGIPVLAVDRRGHDEAVGDGGLLVAPDAPIDDWLAALATIWDDDATYARLVEQARAHANRPEVDTDTIVDRFEELLGTLLAGPR